MHIKNIREKSTKKIKNENRKLEIVGSMYDEKKGYIENTYCTNCEKRELIYVPYGMKIKDYLRDKKCTNCRCVGVLC